MLYDSYYPVDPNIISSQFILPYDLFSITENGVLELARARYTPLEKTSITPIVSNDTVSCHVINKKDLYAYCAQFEKCLMNCFSDDTVSISDKTKMAYNALRVCAELFFSDRTAENYSIYKKVIQTVFKEKPDLRQKQGMLKAMSDSNRIANHNVNVGLFGMGLCMMLRDEIDFDYLGLATALFVHDIGKCAVPPEVMNKKSFYTPIDRNVMHRHPEKGLAILRTLTSVDNVMRQVVLHHHERLNGKGYPDGLKGADVSFYARIAAIADVFDGLTADRPHRKGYSTFEALKIMNLQMPGHLDPNLLSTFAKLFVL